jgi:Fe-S cluster assembly scaffold protein SufB
MAHKPNRAPGDAAIAALASPIRQEIVDTIESLGGDAAVVDIAAQIGRAADGLYYHLNQLVKAGVLLESESDERGRRYRTRAKRGQRVLLDYGKGSRADADALSKLAGTLLRTAERDFVRASGEGNGVSAGDQRDLWIARSKGWVSSAELRTINRLLAQLSKVLHRARSAQRDRMVSLSWVLAPVDDQPLRRPPARERRLQRRKPNG